VVAWTYKECKSFCYTWLVRTSALMCHSPLIYSARHPRTTFFRGVAAPSATRTHSRSWCEGAKEDAVCTPPMVILCADFATGCTLPPPPQQPFLVLFFSFFYVWLASSSKIARFCCWLLHIKFAILYVSCYRSPFPHLFHHNLSPWVSLVRTPWALTW